MGADHDIPAVWTAVLGGLLLHLHGGQDLQVPGGVRVLSLFTHTVMAEGLYQIARHAFQSSGSVCWRVSFL